MSEAAGSNNPPTFTAIKVEYDGPIGRLILNRPEKLNALDWRMYRPGDEFSQALDALEANPDVKVIIIKGAGRAFSSGGDLQGEHGGKDLPPVDDLKWMEALQSNALRLWRGSKPTISQVHGYCLAAGLIFAMASDLVYVAEDARLGQPEARAIGMASDFAHWPLSIGLRRTKELLFTGDVVTGREAADMGMVNAALPPDELEAYVEWIAHRLAMVDPDLLGLYKRAVNDVADTMGLSQTFAIGAKYQALAHWIPRRQAFWAEIKEHGPKAAFRARDDAFGGATPRSALWEQHKQG